MGLRNHLHVCLQCGIVQATSSSREPRKCAVCDASTFTELTPASFVSQRTQPPVLGHPRPSQWQSQSAPMTVPPRERS